MRPIQRHFWPAEGWNIFLHSARYLEHAAGNSQQTVPIPSALFDSTPGFLCPTGVQSVVCKRQGNSYATYEPVLKVNSSHISTPRENSLSYSSGLSTHRPLQWRDDHFEPFCSNSLTDSDTSYPAFEEQKDERASLVATLPSRSMAALMTAPPCS